MKIKALMMAVLIVSGVSAYRPASSSGPHRGAPAVPYTAVPLYRMVEREAMHYHFYTADEAERAKALSVPGNYWVDEGIACYVFKTKAPGTVPLYVASKVEFGGTNHFYTKEKEEMDQAVKTGWVSKGIACYISPTKQEGTLQLVRMYKDTNWSIEKDAHFYTTNPKEVSYFRTRSYKFEGVVGYVWKEPVTINTSELTEYAGKLGLLKPPDLIISNALMSGPGKFRVCVKNIGEGASNTSVLINVNSSDSTKKFLMSLSYDPLGPGKERCTDFPVSLEKDALIRKGVNLVLDPYNKVKESNEQNNTGSYGIGAFPSGGAR